MNDRPEPDAVLLAEAAERHRVTVAQVLTAWQYGRSGGRFPATLDEAAEWAYDRRKGIELLAQDQSRRMDARTQEVADRYGLKFMDVVRERHDGDWPDDESAARALVERRGQQNQERDTQGAGLQRQRVPLEWWLLGIVIPLLAMALFIALRPT